jgi:peptidyl-prolyl cis-trans isomerase B (cyclophilin B)
VSGSQFYLCVTDNSGLDLTYTVFGEVFRGMEKMGSLVVLLLAERAQ